MQRQNVNAREQRLGFVRRKKPKTSFNSSVRPRRRGQKKRPKLRNVRKLMPRNVARIVRRREKWR